jgi:hypothetical protein
MLCSGVRVVAYIASSNEYNMVYFTTFKPLLSGFETDSALPIIFCCQYIQVQFGFNLKPRTRHSCNGISSTQYSTFVHPEHIFWTYVTIILPDKIYVYEAALPVHHM